MYTEQLERIGWFLHKIYPNMVWFIRPRVDDPENADVLIVSTQKTNPVAVFAFWDRPVLVVVNNVTFFKLQLTINKLDEISDHERLGLPMPRTYTIDQFRKYLTSSDTLSDAVHYLSESNIEAANIPDAEQNEITGVE